MDLMMDIETLSHHPEAIILNISAIAFDPLGTDIYTDQSFYSRIDLETQENRHEDPKTLEWWSKQPKKAIEESFGEENRMPLNDALDRLTELAVKCKRVWTNGIAFDMPIIEHAYREKGDYYPWNFWDVVDCRTILKINPGKKLGNSHHALEDCINQVVMLQSQLKKLGIKEIA